MTQLKYSLNKMVGAKTGSTRSFAYAQNPPAIVFAEVEGEDYDLFHELYAHAWSRQLVDNLNDNANQVSTKALLIIKNPTTQAVFHLSYLHECISAIK